MSDSSWMELRQQLRDLMWEGAGITRSDATLNKAASQLQDLRKTVEQRFQERGISPEAIQMRNLTETAMLVVKSAQTRKESRGLHYNVDYPYRDNELFLRDTIVKRETH